jgi:magnesium transporter
MFTHFDFRSGKIVPAEEGRGKLVVCTRPDGGELSILENTYGIGPHSLASAADPDELGRIEKKGDHWSFIIKIPCNYTAEDRLLFTVTSMGLFLFKNTLIVVTPEPFDLSDYRHVESVRSARDAFLSILYGTTIHFVSHIKVITMLSESLEKRINTSMENHFLLNMFTLEKSLVFFMNGIDSNEVVIGAIKENAAKIRFTSAQLEILGEIIVENRQCSKQTEIYSNILTGLMDARSSVVNNNLSVLIKRLTIVSVVFMPLNLLAAMGGMSEYSAWTAKIPWWLSYSFFLVLLVLIGLAAYRYLMVTTAAINEKKTKTKPVAFKGDRPRFFTFRPSTPRKT